jgi:hypothetical protein
MRLFMLSALVGFVAYAVPGTAVAQCRPGDHLIGEDANAYYCSRRTCSELKTQLERDKNALARQKKSFEDTSRELDHWGKENNKAAQDAFKHATLLLHDSVLGSLERLTNARIEEMRKSIWRNPGPTGLTFTRLVEKTQEMQRRSARLHGLADALSLSQYPFSNLTTAYADLKNWAAEIHSHAEDITAIIAEMRKDADGRKALAESGISFVSDGLKIALRPLVAQSLSLGEFFVNYGYDATVWVASRNRIMQNLGNQDAQRIALCKLDAQLKQTVRDYNICQKRYPAPNRSIPRASDCR